MKASKIINIILGFLALIALALVVVYVIFPFFEKPGKQVSKDSPKELARNGKENGAAVTEATETKDSPFSFVVLSDSNGGGGSIKQPAVFTDAIQEIAAAESKPNLLIHAGDMIAGSSSTSLSLAGKMWTEFYATIKPLEENNIAFFPSAGNHDASFNRILPRAYQEFWDSHQRAQNISINGSYSSYYSFDFQTSHFIILYAPKTYLAEEQLAWLEQEVENAQNKYDNIFVISHLPLTAVSTYHPNDQLAPSKRLKNILREKITVFFGAHHNLYYDFEADGIRQIGVGKTGSGGNYRFKSQYGQGSQNYNSYLRVDVDEANIDIEQVIK